METIFYAIGAVVVLGIVAFFVLKKLQAQKIHLPTVVKPRLPTKQAQATPEAVTPPTDSDITVAETHINNQNYNEAINELKRILIINPRHSKALLRLLQTYGITKQYQAFNQLYQKIHEIADGETIREADFCKSLLEEEMSALAKPVTPPQPSPSNQATMVAPVVAASVVAASSQVAPDVEQVLDFDFAAPVSDSSASVAATPISQAAHHADAFDLDFDVKSEVPSSGLNTHEVLDDRELILDFNAPDEEGLPSSVTSSTEPTLSFDELMFDEPLSNPTNEASVLTFDSLASDISPSLDSTPNTHLAFDTDTSSELDRDLESELSFDFPDLHTSEASPTKDADDLTFDVPPSKAHLDASQSEVLADLSDSTLDEKEEAFDFDFNLATESPVTSDTTNITAPSDTSDGLMPDDSMSDNLVLDEFDFNFEANSSGATLAQTSTSELPDAKMHTEASFGDIDFTFDADTPSIDNASLSAKENDDFLLDSLDPKIDLVDEFTDSEPIFSSAPQTPDLTADLDIAPTLEADNTLVASELDVSDEMAFGELDLDLTDLNATESQASAQDDELLAFDDVKSPHFEVNDGLDLVDETTFDITPTTDTSDTGLDSKLLDDALASDEFDFSDTSAQEVGLVSEPEHHDETLIAPIQAATPLKTNPINHLDEANITLNLAKQYLDLGEYDSAKRLLGEVIQTGNASQKQDAKSLIAQMM